MPLIVLDEALLGYMAGLFDGEGSFSILVDVRDTDAGTPYVLLNPRMTINMKNSLPAQQLFVDAFGGKIYSSKTHPGINQWVLGTREMLKDAAITLRPHLRVKSDIASRFLEALDLYPPSRHRTSKGAKAWSLENILKVYAIASTLNPNTARRSKRGVEYMATLREVYEKNPTAIFEGSIGGPPKGARRVKDADGKWHGYTPEEARALGIPDRVEKGPPKFTQGVSAAGDLSIEEAKALCEGVDGIRAYTDGKNRRYFIATVKKSKRFPDTPEGLADAKKQQEVFNQIAAPFKKIASDGLRVSTEKERGVSWHIARLLVRRHYPLSMAGFAMARVGRAELEAGVEAAQPELTPALSSA